MRVLFISDHADPTSLPGRNFQGGQNVYVRRLATSLAASGCDVDVATRWSSPDLPERQPIAPGASVIRIRAGDRAPLSRDRFGEVLDEFTVGVGGLVQNADGYDVIHSHYWYSGQAALRISREYGVALVHTHHSVGIVRRAALKDKTATIGSGLFAERHRAETEIGQHADALVVSCPAEAADAEHLLSTPRDRVHLVPPGIDIGAFRPEPRLAARAALGLPPDVPVVLFIGRLEARKGCHDLITAFALVHERFPAARLLVVGGVPGDADASMLVALTERLGLRDNVHFHGSVPHEQTTRYYSAADVTAVPSHYEPFGLVAIESMACGTPVVATRVGGLSWTVEDQRTGALVPVIDPPGLAAAVVRVLLTGPDRYRRACLDRVATQFTTDSWTSSIREIYHGVAAPDNARRRSEGRRRHAVGANL